MGLPDQEERARNISNIKTDRVVGHWKNWDQLVSAESGGATPATASNEALEGAKQSALYAMNKGGRWCRRLRGKSVCTSHSRTSLGHSVNTVAPGHQIEAPRPKLVKST